MFPCTHLYTNRTCVGTRVYNGRYSHTSGRRERAPSRTDWINDSQKGADSLGKAVSTDSICSYWLMAHENYTSMLRFNIMPPFVHFWQERTHPRGQIGSIKTHRRAYILQVRL